MPITYKGVDITNIYQSGNNTRISNISLAGPPSPFEKSNPIGIKINGQDLSDLATTKYYEFNSSNITNPFITNPLRRLITGGLDETKITLTPSNDVNIAGTYNYVIDIPSGCKHISAYGWGGGGGSGGKGGDGCKGPSGNTPGGGSGGDGGRGGYFAISKYQLNPLDQRINIAVGAGGLRGNNGNNRSCGTNGNTGSGNDGRNGIHGGTSSINIVDTTTVSRIVTSANGGLGGSGGGSGNANNQGGNGSLGPSGTATYLSGLSESPGSPGIGTNNIGVGGIGNSAPSSGGYVRVYLHYT